MKIIATFILAAASLFFVASASAAKPVFGELYYDGDIVRTVIPPAAAPKRGRDDIYPVVMGGVEGQLAIAAVAPGDRDYHGGKWAVNVVMWKMGVDAYLLTSEDEVLAAEDVGDVIITRVPDADFKCPIQP